jgi:aminodeoxyfutalosine synthase
MKDILEKIDRAERLSLEDGVRLFDHRDGNALGMMANKMRERLHGNAAFYNVNRHLNHTDICVNRCAFCAFSRDQGDAAGYRLSLDEIARAATEAAAEGCTEIHVTGGLHPAIRLADAAQMLSALRRAAPALHLKAFTAVEIDYFARMEKIAAEDCLKRLMEAGLGSLPGGGAEIFSPRVRAVLCPDKLDGAGWLAVHRAAHRLGLKTNCTMLFGHVETAGERADHLLKLRALQDETCGFQCFVPLAFHPFPLSPRERAGVRVLPGSAALASVRPPSAIEALRVVAASRLMLDNVPHVKAYWVSLGVAAAQAALGYGADDIDGTVRMEKIHHAAGARSPEGLTKDEIRRLIAEAGRDPVERDSLYRPVRGAGCGCCA